MKTLLQLTLCATALLALTSCDIQQSVDQKQADVTEQLQSRANSKFGLPNITTFEEKRRSKEIYELRDRAKLLTYSYTQSEMTGRFVFLGKTIGFPLPGAVQYSNPERAVEDVHGNYTLPQPEPNGLFMPPSMDATWILMIDPVSHEASPSYIEAKVNAFTFPLPNAEYPAGGPQYADLISK